MTTGTFDARPASWCITTGLAVADDALRRGVLSELLGDRAVDAAMCSVRDNCHVLPIVGIRPLSGRTGTTLLMNLLGTSSSIAFDRRYPAEYRIGSYLAQMALQMTEPFDERTHVGVTDFFFGSQPSWGPMPFRSDALDIQSWRPELLRSMWASASDALLTACPDARWYSEKLAVDEGPLREAGVEVFTIDLVRDPRDILASRRSFLAGGTDHWDRDAELVASGVDRPAQHVTTPSARASVGRWRSDLDEDDAATLTTIAEQLGY